jgi:hypothetical protein
MQQINLYLPEFQPNREPMRSIHMLWGLVLFLVLLVVFSFYTVNTNKQKTLMLETSRQQLEATKSRLTQLEQQRPQQNLAQLDADIVRLQNELQRRQQILGVIADKKLGNNTGYSAHLYALGEQALDSISLQAFSLLQGGAYVEFAGKTLAADQVPFYIQRLRTQPAFAEASFGVLRITPAASGGAFDFFVARDNPRNSAAVGKTAVQMLLQLNEQAATSTARGNN